MKNPRPIHLTTDEEFASQRWAAVSRDCDGHAMGCHAPFESLAERNQYIDDEARRGCKVTFFDD